MRRRIHEPDSIYVTTRLPRDVLARIDDFVMDELLGSRAEAMRILIERGLQRAGK